MVFSFFSDYKDDLLKAFEHPRIQEIAISDEFYYQKAKDKFEEFRRFDITGINIDGLITVTSKTPFSFEKWLNSYKVDSAEYKLLFLIGQVVSYFDTHAAMKNVLNEYTDKHVVANARVRQNRWVGRLLEFKKGDDMALFPHNIRKTITYIQSPEANLNIVSEDYRSNITENLFGGGNLGGDLDSFLFKEMKKLEIKAKNPLNDGVLYTRILYSDAIKELWFEVKEDPVSAPTTQSTSASLASKPAKNTILCGPPGTGKTYSTVLYAVSIIEEKLLEEILLEEKLLNEEDVFKRYQKHKKDGLVAFTTFHQSFGYEEFIEGIRPVVSTAGREIEYEVHDGIFKAFCDKAGTDKRRNRNHVFIIDEINRGNISKIFGELITLIEPTKRIGAKEELRALLPYSGQNFGVPDNVYLIGTMNTADRSIALIDTALRRRFSFVEMQPDSERLSKVFVGSIDIRKMLDTLNMRITVLLDREHTIGHSYLLPLKEDPTIERLAAIFKDRVVPLLQEYFYDDYEKIRLVLGDDQKPDDSTRFIIRRKTKADDLFGKANIDFDLPEYYYEINDDKVFMDIRAYGSLQYDLHHN